VIAKANRFSFTAIFTALIIAASPALAQQSANQIVGAEPPKQTEIKPQQPADVPPVVQQMVAAPVVMPPNAILPPLPSIVKKSANAIAVGVPPVKGNAPSINMIQTPATVENSEPDDAAPAKPATVNPTAPVTPKVEVIKPETQKYEAQPISSSSVRVNSNFGYRYDPFTGNAKFHAGVDLKATWGDPVCASQAGIIKFAGWHNGYGYMVTVDHGGGISTNYAHLSRLALPVGTRVTRGTVIGSAGSTGRSTSPHLHYEVRVNDHPVNPMHPIALEENSEYFTLTQNLTTQMQPAVPAAKEIPGSSTKIQQQQ
jgi:murein DD-endopeptidase MepM/ murein hydrolase activator NlpD